MALSKIFNSSVSTLVLQKMKMKLSVNFLIIVRLNKSNSHCFHFLSAKVSTSYNIYCSVAILFLILLPFFSLIEISKLSVS